MGLTEGFREWREQRLSEDDETRWRYYGQRDLAVMGAVLAAAVGAVWWWALLGMTSEVGFAVSLTVLLVLVPTALDFLSVSALLVKADKKKQAREERSSLEVVSDLEVAILEWEELETPDPEAEREAARAVVERAGELVRWVRAGEAGLHGA